jgi:hypothetical protein
MPKLELPASWAAVSGEDTDDIKPGRVTGSIQIKSLPGHDRTYIAPAHPSLERIHATSRHAPLRSPRQRNRP